MAIARLLPLLAAVGSVVGKTEPLVAKGSKFFYPNGTQFFIKGIAYQSDVAQMVVEVPENTHYWDVLASEKDCKRDVPRLKDLHINTIRVYSVDPTADHSACMTLLQDAGIYVVADLGEPRLSINREYPEWNEKLFSRYKSVIDELAQYPNVFGFFAGNEVTSNKSLTGAAPFVKAAVRDSKKYIQDKVGKSRWLGVGYAAVDNDYVREQEADYYNCGAVDESIDFFGYNIYSWCGDSDMETSKWGKRAQFFHDYSVPVFFAEYGCNDNEDRASGRIFTDVEALYKDAMTDVFSGGIMYMYFQEANDYGLVKVSNGKLTEMKNYNVFKKKLGQADPKPIDMDQYKPAGKIRECPAVEGDWEASSKSLPPTPDQSLCDCMVKASTCVPSGNLTPEKMSELFGSICGSNKSLCSGISTDSKESVFGTYSMCDGNAKLANILDAYHKQYKTDPNSCHFGGSATTQEPSSDETCSAAMASATEKSKQASAGGKASKSEDSFAAHGISFTRALSVSNSALGFYMVAALGAGAATIIL